MPHSIFISVLNMSLVASYVIMFVLIARLLLKKAPKIFPYVLWAVVLVRLLYPFSFESTISLLPNTITNNTIVSEFTDDYVGTINIYHDNTNEYKLALEQGIEPISAGEGGYYVVTGVDGISQPDTILPILTNIWLIGIAVMVVYSVISLIKLRRKLIGATPLEKNIYIADHIDSPFVMGFIRPKIYLPSNLTDAERDFIIKHEQTHIKRLDHITRILAFTSLAVHWFNPFVWIAFVLSSKDMETSCDEAVMKKMNTDIRADYSEALLKFATGKKLITATPLAFGEGDTKGRVKNVMKYKKPVVWVSAICLVLVGIVAFSLMSNSKGSILKQDSMKQAQNLSVENVEKIELVTYPNDSNSYYLFDQSEFEEIISLVNESNGRYIENPEPIAGGGQTLYITKNDGNILTVGNNGNIYLVINGDSFDADYDWLNENWNFVGDEPVPENFHYGEYETKSSDDALIAEFEAIVIGTLQEEVREKFGEPDSMLSGMYGDIYVAGDKMAIIYYEFNEEKAYPVTEVVIDNRQIVTNDEVDITSASVTDTATSYVQGIVDYYDDIGEEHDFQVTNAAITNLSQISTGTANNDHSINLYKLEYRISVDNIDNVPLAGGMSIDNGKITEWGSTGQPYFLFYDIFDDDKDEILIETTNTDIIFVDYGSDEYLEKYGTAYAAYAMETYEKYLSSLEDIEVLSKIDDFLQVMEYPEKFSLDKYSYDNGTLTILLNQSEKETWSRIFEFMALNIYDNIDEIRNIEFQTSLDSPTITKTYSYDWYCYQTGYTD